MVVWTLALQLIRGGPAGLSAWFAAKFWNGVTSSSPAGAAGAGGLGGTGVAGAGGAGAATAHPGAAPGMVLGPGTLDHGGPTQIAAPGHAPRWGAV